MAARAASSPPGVLDAIAEIIGTEHVVTEPDVLRRHEVDWTGRFVGRTPALLRPASTEEVAAVLAVCNEAGTAVVPQGGNTGLVGGGVPLRGQVVLSTERLTELGPVDPLTDQVTAGAGVTLAALDAHAARAGLAYAVDLAARDSATVGGSIATNAGGMHVLRWGATRAQLRGIEVVLADGRVLRHLGGLTKDNTGYDLAGLVCGSEGTLGVVTRARLALVERPARRVVALCAFADVATAVEAASSWRRSLPQLDAAELFLQSGLELVREATGAAAPFDRPHAAYVLLEASGRRDPTTELADAVDAARGVEDVAVGSDGPSRRRLWAYREDHTVAISTLGPPHKLDVTLPASALAEFLERVPSVVTAVVSTARTWLFGHVGDGNVHVNVTGVAPDDDRIDDAVLELVASLGGSISAEHGIGSAKRRWLHLNRSPEEIATFRAIKAALDPVGILNPGVLLPD